MQADAAQSGSQTSAGVGGRRVAFLVGPLVPESGEDARRIDVEALAERFRQDDMGFEVHVLDPRNDVAEQVEIVFEGEPAPARSVVFYAFAPGIIDQDDLLLCFDPREPDVGDSFREILTVCLEHAEGPVLAVLELKPRASDALSDEEVHAVDLAERARRIARFVERPVELIVAVGRSELMQPDAEEHTGADASAFTRLLLAKLEGTGRGVNARDLYKELAADQSALALTTFGYGASTGDSLAFLEDDAELPARRRESRIDLASEIAAAEAAAAEGAWNIAPGEDTHELAPLAPPSMAAISLSSVPPTTIAPPAATDLDDTADGEDTADGVGEPSDDAVALPDEARRAEAATAIAESPAPDAVLLDADSQDDRAPDDGTPAAALGASHDAAMRDTPLPVSSEAPPTEPMAEPPVFAGAAAGDALLPPAPVITVPPTAVPPTSVPPTSVPPTGDHDHLRDADAALVTGQYEQALESLRRALGFGNLSKEKKGEVYVRMAEAKEALGRHKEAISNLEKALGFVDAGMGEVILLDLMRLHFAEEDFREALVTQERLLKGVATPKGRFDMLVEFGRTWLKYPDERMRARQMLERAWEIDDQNLDLCRVLRDLAERDDRDEDAVNLTKRMCDLEPDPRKRSQRLVRLAGALIDRQREDEAVTALLQSIDVEVRELSALEMLADVFSERQEWSQLEALYRTVLGRLDSFDPEARADIEAELARRLGLVLRDHLEDHTAALEAFSRAARAKPRDASARKLAIDVARDIGDHVSAREHLIALSVVEPGEQRVYRLLFETHMRLGATERAIDAASILVHYDVASDRERVVYQSAKEDSPPRYKATLEPPDWPLIVEPLSALGVAGEILAIAGRATAIAVAEAAKRKDRGEQIEVAKSTVSAVRAFDWACRTLGVPTPTIFLDDTLDAGFVPGWRAGGPTMHIGRAALRGLGVAELSALAGRNAIFAMPEHALLSACSSMEELTLAFIAIVRTVMSELPLSEVLAVRAGLLVPRIEARLDPADRRKLAELARVFDEQGGRFDLLRYVEGAERAGGRAALLVAGDLPATIGALSSSKGHFATLSAEEIERDLVTFAVSDAFVEVRRRVGVELESD